MAKKDKLKTGEFQLDGDLDFDFDNFDAQFSSSSKNKDRSVVKDVFKGTITGSLGTFKNPGFLARKLKKALPDEYGEVFKAVDETHSKLSSLYDQTIRDVKPQLGQLATKIDRLVPAESARLKKITNKLSDMFDDNKTRSYEGPSQEDIQTQSINNSLAEVFGAQQEVTNQIEARRRAEGKVDRAIDHKRFTANYGVLSSINENMARMTNYTTKVNQSFQKKSLELQYRSYFVQSQLLDLTSKYYEVFKEQNEGLIKNSALPDAVKLKNSEFYMQKMKGKFADKINNKLFGEQSIFSLAVDRLGKQVRSGVDKFKSNLDGAINITDMLGSAMESVDSMGDLGNGSKGQTAGEMIGGFLADMLADKGINKYKDKVKNNSTVKKYGFKSLDYLMNFSGKMGKLRKNNQFIKDNKYSPDMKGVGANLLDMMFSLFSEEEADFNIGSRPGIGSLKEVNTFDNKAHRSLTEVIPGYLSRIYRELIVTRTGNPNVSMPVFDFNTGKFSNKSQLTADVKNTLKNKADSGLYKYSINKAFDSLKGDAQVSEKVAVKSKLFLSKLSRENMDYSADDILNSDLFKGLNSETQDFLRSRLENINNSENKDEKQSALTSSLVNIKKATPDMRAEIEAYVDAGYSDILEEEGIIDIDSKGEISINKTKYYKIVNSAVFAKSDINVKRNISKFDPKQALNKVKNTKIYNWFYKLNKGDQGPKTGPMAQDVKANMGDDVAPNGTEIDLTAMNGINMSAIQALQSNQEKLLKQEGNLDVLGQIKQDTGKLVELLQLGTFRLALSNGEMTIKDVKNYITGKASALADKAGGLISKLMTKAKWTARKVNRNMIRPAKNAVQEFYNDNKDDAKDAVKSMFSKAGEFAGSVYTFGKDLLTKKIPDQINIFKGKASEFIKDALDILDRPVDLYLKGKSEPVLRAALMEQGMYIDEATGKVIRSFKDIKGNVLDKFGNIIVSATEMKDGFFNRHGEAIKSRFFRFADSARNFISGGINKMKDLAGNAFNFLSGKLSGSKEKGQGFLSGLFGMSSSQRIYDVLVEIRDILAGNAKGSAKKGKSIASYIKSAPSTSEIVNMEHKRIIDTGAIKERLTGLINKAKAKFFDRDGDGDRDNSWMDRLSNWKNKTKDKAKVKFDEVKARYKDGNIIDSIIGKVTGLFTMLTSGMGGIFDIAGGLFGKLGKLGGVLGKGAGLLGKGALGIGKLAGGLAFGGAKLAGSAALGVGKFALTLGSLGLSGIGSAVAATATTALTAVGSILASPVVIGVLATGAVAYAGYKAYKYLTRNDADKFFRIRLKQYGLALNDVDKHHIHEINKLEAYMNDNKIRMNYGTPVILEANIKGEEILEIFGIDKEDKERMESFLRWFHTRFKPFFLTHYAALYNINPKIKLSEIEGSLDKISKVKYLDAISFDSGPYDVTDSPFGDITTMLTNKNIIKEDIEKLKSELKGNVDPTSKENSKKVDVTKMVQDKAKMHSPKDVMIDEITPMINSIKKENQKETSVGEGDGVNLGKSATITDVSNNSASTSAVGNINMAKGPMATGQGADQYMILGKGVNLENLHPIMLRNFKAMIEEYGELTGKKVNINDGFRSRAEQARMKAKYGDRAAKPGSSLHEFGLAIDASSAAMNEMEKLGLMKKYGFTRPVGGEPWHVEPIGIQQDIAKAKFDPNFATNALNSSPGRGGGGLGTIAGAPKYKRDKNMALAIFNSGSNINLAANDPSINGQTSQVASSATSQSGPVAGQSLNTSPINTNNRSEVAGKIEEVSKVAGVDPNLVKTFAAMESSMNPNAKASKGSSSGLYGFINTTWDASLAKHGGKYGLDAESKPTDVTASTAMAAEYIKDNIKSISKYKSNPTSTDVYLAHFLGPTGAKKIITANPNAYAADILPDAAAKPDNKSYFFNRDGKKLTVSEFYSKIQNKVNNKASEFGINLSNTATQGVSAPTQAANDPNKNIAAVSSPVIPATDKQPNVLSGFNPAAIGENTSTMGSSLNKSDLSATNQLLTKSLEIEQQQLAVLKEILSKLDLDKIKQSYNKDAVGSSAQNNARRANESVIDLNRKVI